MFGYDLSEMYGLSMDSVVRDCDYKGALEGEPVPGKDARLAGQFQAPLRVERLCRKNGDQFVAEVSSEPVISRGRVIGTVMTARDLTETMRQQDALRRSEKLAALGRMVSSIVHEINNPLESMMNLLYLINDSKSLDDVHAYAEMAQSELKRATEITLQTLRFGRQPNKPVTIDLEELVCNVLALYAARFAMHSIKSELRAVGMTHVCGLEGELRQVVNNLVRNALDAMSDGEKLRIRLHPEHHPRTMSPGVRVTIADTGEGIRQDIEAHLFQPFRTSKENMGTGLGLWVSRGIVEKHGGRIRVRTRRGDSHGTVFTVWLPTDGGTNLRAQEDR